MTNQPIEDTTTPTGPMLDARNISESSDSIHTNQFGRVLDVPLSVTLRFGQRAMQLRDVLELTTGSLVELDREVEEPVELMLGDRVIARGEVVIIDGNYGLRVQEVIERVPALSAAAKA